MTEEMTNGGSVNTVDAGSSMQVQQGTGNNIPVELQTNGQPDTGKMMSVITQLTDRVNGMRQQMSHHESGFNDFFFNKNDDDSISYRDEFNNSYTEDDRKSIGEFFKGINLTQKQADEIVKRVINDQRTYKKAQQEAYESAQKSLKEDENYTNWSELIQSGANVAFSYPSTELNEGEKLVLQSACSTKEGMSMLSKLISGLFKGAESYQSRTNPAISISNTVPTGGKIDGYNYQSFDNATQYKFFTNIILDKKDVPGLTVEEAKKLAASIKSF